MSERILEGMGLVIEKRAAKVRSRVRIAPQDISGEDAGVVNECEQYAQDILHAVTEYHAAVAELEFLESQYKARDAVDAARARKGRRLPAQGGKRFDGP